MTPSSGEREDGGVEEGMNGRVDGRVDARVDGGAVRVPCERHGKTGPGEDRLVVEEPLEIRVGGTAIATLMRTPGDDLDLALGFLVSEGWIASKREIGALALCGRGTVEENVVDLLLPAGTGGPGPSPRPRLLSTSSCGVCGKRTIAEVLARTPLSRSRAERPGGAGAASGGWPAGGAGGTERPGERARDGFSVAAAVLGRLPDVLRAEQRLFDATGSLHAAAIFDAAGSLLAAREDIGRHNAVDKVVGWGVGEGALPLSRHVLQVSGRTSFEIVQKALAAGIPVVAGVSGVSSLALELARAAGMTLIGFARGGRFTVYCGCERITERSDGDSSRDGVGSGGGGDSDDGVVVSRSPGR
jgi:FdhD protein